MSLASINSPTLFIGDFNYTRFPRERFPGCNRSYDSTHFKLWIRQSNMEDLQLCNAKFTWIGPNGRRSRIDRAMVNVDWNDKGCWKLKALPRKNYDHRAFLLQTEKNWGQNHFKSLILGSKKKV